METNDNINLSRRTWLKKASGLLVAALGAPLMMRAAQDDGSGEAPGNGSRAAHINPAARAVAEPDKRSRVAKLRKVDCRQCDMCMPCSYGIDIPANFRVYNELLKADAVPDIYADNPEAPEFRRKARKFLRSYARAIPDKHQSQRCVHCNRCMSECQENVLIVNELAAITRLTDFLKDWECSH